MKSKSMLRATFTLAGVGLAQLPVARGHYDPTRRYEEMRLDLKRRLREGEGKASEAEIERFDAQAGPLFARLAARGETQRLSSMSMVIR